MKTARITWFAIFAIQVLGSAVNGQRPIARNTPARGIVRRFFPAPGFEKAMLGGRFLGLQCAPIFPISMGRAQQFHWTGVQAAGDY